LARAKARLLAAPTRSLGVIRHSALDLQHCATSAIREGNPEKTQQVYDELLELIYKHLR